MAKTKGARSFGSLRKLPSGRYQARFPGPDGRTYTARRLDGGPLTFTTKTDANAYLVQQQADIIRGTWVRPGTHISPMQIMTFGDYAEEWLEDRGLEAKTLYDYRSLLKNHIYKTFADQALTEITATNIRTWWSGLRKRGVGDTTRSHAYGVLRTILKTAFEDELIAANPCHIRGAGTAASKIRNTEPATVEELATLVAAMPARYRMMVLLAAWGAFRFGELAELRRSDVDIDRGVVRIRRAASRGQVIKAPKGNVIASKRDVHLPPHLLPALADHLRDHTELDQDALLFPAQYDPSRHMAPSTLYKVFYPARRVAGRPDLRFHDLRHTGATLAAQTGATVAELMARLGHRTPQMAMRYQHAAAERDRAIAQALSKMATG